MNARPAAKSTHNQAEVEPAHEEIQVAAYHLYLHSGCQEGRSWENWFRAEELLRQRLRERKEASLAEQSAMEPAIPARPPAARRPARNRPSVADREEVRALYSRPARQPHQHRRQRHVLADQ